MLALEHTCLYAAGMTKKPRARKNPIAAALAKLRAKKLSPERRRQIAQNAARVRWKVTE
jgi:hypothetical protein